MRLSPAQRIVLAGLLMASLGFLAIYAYRLTRDSLDCDSRTIRTLHACSFATQHLTLARILLSVAIAVVLVGLATALAIWALRPIRSLTSMVERLGPQNLAERSPVTSGRDEIARLTVALNAMMDRLAAGYEGQRSFAANASHELRTPLAVQRTLIEVSMVGARSPDQVALLTEQLLATNERNERLIEGLLVLSESDRGLVSRTPQRLDEIARLVVDAHRDLAARASITLVAEFSECEVLGEQVLLERLVTNLVRNAILYNVPDGDVTVQVGGPVALTVENSGPVIPAESVGGLFEPFRRGSGERTHHGGGAGLGLTIVRSICAAHEGTVVARPGPRGGLRVDVSLPGSV